MRDGKSLVREIRNALNRVCVSISFSNDRREVLLAALAPMQFVTLACD